jgi:hypothetical protein
MAPLVIPGECIGFVYTEVLHGPLVFERERINSDDGENPR